ncbi:MAG: PEP/pyruvate-binding domain-containing protein [Pseudomonadota bacterium]
MSASTTTYTESLSAGTQSLELEKVGGKGRSLMVLKGSSSCDVPPGFVVCADAYRDFVATHGVQEQLMTLAKPAIDTQQQLDFESASRAIAELLLSLPVPNEIIEAVRTAYNELVSDNGRDAVAVRSSANAEDLPDLSFAGQQETFLNISGADDVLEAVRNCWASLWTPQAMRYRHEMGIEPDLVAMAVVVQTMVPADVAGVLFTANPATGERGEMVLTANPGLGEAVVSGQVTPDTFLIDRETGTVSETIVGTKEQMVVADGASGTRTDVVPDDVRERACLSPGQIQTLKDIAHQIEDLFEGGPQDIEWAMVGDACHILQARPITNLPPPPLTVEWTPIPGAQLLKRQVAENMPQPLSPLFEDMYLKSIFDTQKWPEGFEWQGNLTKNWMKNFVVITMNGYAYQPIYFDSSKDWQKFVKAEKTQSWWQQLKNALVRPWYLSEVQEPGFSQWLLATLSKTVRTFRRFPGIVTWERQQLPDYLASIEHWKQLDAANATSEELLEGMQALSTAEVMYWHALRSVIGTAKLTDGPFQAFLEEHAAGQGFISGTFLSGFPSRTLDAESMMGEIAHRIRSHPSLREVVLMTPASRVMDALRQHPEGGSVLGEIQSYLQTYGRQVFDLDFVEPTLEEAPEPFIVNLKAQVRSPGRDLKARQREVRVNRRRQFRAALRFFKGRQRIEFIRMYLTARVNYPAREEALFYMGLAWSTFRPFALTLGQRLVDAGILLCPDDVFYLRLDDLRRGVAEPASCAGFAGEVADQQLLREQRMRLAPPPAIPPLKEDNSPFAAQRDNTGSEHILRGFAVSPGKVTGEARVIMSPADFDEMRPDTILVCPLTTPAWTQLFPHAKGLVTDIGSILAHGSIVAREYGIPAVLGIGDATQRIRTGQMIEVDGDQGVVTILEDNDVVGNDVASQDHPRMQSG